MKVLVLTSLYPNNIQQHFGVFVKERMTAYSRLGVSEVKVVAPVPYFPPLQINRRWIYSQILRREVIEGLEVFHPRYFMIPKIGMAFQGLLMFMAVFRFISRLKKQYDFDIIDSHYVYPDGFAAVLTGQLLKCPVIVSARGTDINLYSRFPVIRRLLKFTLRRADHMIAVCQALKDVMVELEVPAEKITVIPNGVDMGKFRRIPKIEARRVLGLPLDKKILLSVGGLIPRKGFHVLIDALKILKQVEQRDLYLVIVGEGEFRPDLERRIRNLGLLDSVLLVGGVPHEQLFSWYSAADLFCLASDREGWPNVILEALACGVPVVATDVWGIPEVIQDSSVGILTQRDENKMAAAIHQALNTNWIETGIVEYVSKFSWDRAAQSVHQVFQAALRTNGVAEPSEDVLV